MKWPDQPLIPLPAGRDLDGVRQWAEAALVKFELRGWRFQVTRAVRTLGTCRYGPRIIGMSRFLIQMNPLEETRDTLLHELAHALVGPQHGHGPLWRSVARYLGCRPERLAGPGVVMPAGRWVAACGACGRTFRRHRRLRRDREWWCLRCGPERGGLVWGEEART